MPRLHQIGVDGVSYNMFWGDGGHTTWSMPYFLNGKREFKIEDSFGYKLHEKGIETSIVHSNVILVTKNFQNCFNEYLDMGMNRSPVKTFARKALKKLGVYRQVTDIKRNIVKTNVEVPYRRAEAMLEKSQSVLDELKHGVLWIQLMDTHIPYSPSGLDKFQKLEAQSLYRKLLKSIQGEYTITSSERDRLEELYDLECQYMDQHIGLFVENNPDINFIITSDHGDMFGENYTYSHSPGPHGVTPQLGHLPLIFYGPSFKNKVEYEKYNSSINIGTTIMDLFGFQERVGYGKSFLNDVILSSSEDSE